MPLWKELFSKATSWNYVYIPKNFESLELEERQQI